MRNENIVYCRALKNYSLPCDVLLVRLPTIYRFALSVTQTHQSRFLQAKDHFQVKKSVCRVVVKLYIIRMFLEIDLQKVFLSLIEMS